jgi:hypothetical protein
MSTITTISNLFAQQEWAVVAQDDGKYALYYELNYTEEDFVGRFTLAELYLEYMALMGVIDVDQCDACAKELASPSL